MYMYVGVVKGRRVEIVKVHSHHTTYLISSDKPCSILIPPHNAHSATVDRTLLKEAVFGVVVSGNLPTSPTDGYELLFWVPLHTLYDY